MKRIGIYAGTFDPVHAGHLAFGLQALAAGKLDKLYFVPERRPRGKTGVEHFGHRAAMLRQAAKPHARFGVLELPDVSFSVRYTLPRLRKRFGEAELVFLFGSDVAARLPEWPLAERLAGTYELIIGVRAADQQAELQQAISAWPFEPLSVTLLVSHAPAVSSGKIRESLRQGTPAAGSLASVVRYSNRHWLYVALPGAVDTP